MIIVFKKKREREEREDKPSVIYVWVVWTGGNKVLSKSVRLFSDC